MSEQNELFLVDIDEPKKADRLSINPDGIKEMADSILEIGLLQPILVRPVGDRQEIVFGHRRFLAHRLLGRTKIPCTVREMTDSDVALARATENLAREDLTPIEEATIYQNLIDSFDMSFEDVARRMGKSAGTVRHRLDLLKMPPILRDAVHGRKISMSVADELWPISNLADLEYYLHFAIESGCTKTTARIWRQEWQDAKRREKEVPEDRILSKSPFEPRPVYVVCDLCNGPVVLGEEVIVRTCSACYSVLKESSRQEE